MSSALSPCRAPGEAGLLSAHLCFERFAITSRSRDGLAGEGRKAHRKRILRVEYKSAWEGGAGRAWPRTLPHRLRWSIQPPTAQVPHAQQGHDPSPAGAPQANPPGEADPLPRTHRHQASVWQGDMQDHGQEAALRLRGDQLGKQHQAGASRDNQELSSGRRWEGHAGQSLHPSKWGGHGVAGRRQGTPGPACQGSCGVRCPRKAGLCVPEAWPLSGLPAGAQ